MIDRTTRRAICTTERYCIASSRCDVHYEYDPHTFMKITLTEKIAFPFSLLLLLMTVVVIIAFVTQGTVEDQLKQIRKEIERRDAIQNLRASMPEVLSILSSSVQTNRVKIRGDAIWKEIDVHVQMIRGWSIDEKERELGLRIEKQLLSFRTDAQKIAAIQPAAIDSTTIRLALALNQTWKEQISKTLEILFEHNSARLQQTTIEISSTERTVVWYMFTLGIIALAVCIVTILLSVKRISKPLQDLELATQKIIMRDFSHRVRAEGADEIGKLTTSFNAMTDNLGWRLKELENFSFVVSNSLIHHLQGIFGMSDMLLTEYSDAIDENGKESLRMIHSTSLNMSNLINDLYVFAKAAQGDVAKAPVRMNRLIEQVQIELTEVLQKRNAKLTVQEDLPAILCDQSKCTLVWKHLIINAMKFNASAQPIIEIGHIEDHRRPQHETFFIRDNGIGIDPQFHDKIFQPFYRVPTKSKQQGVGMGLAIARRVMDFHLGNIRVESQPGMGAIFYVAFPKQEKKKTDRIS